MKALSTAPAVASLVVSTLAACAIGCGGAAAAPAATPIPAAPPVAAAEAATADDGPTTRASVPYEYACDEPSGFMPNPNEHKRVGYITALSGFGQGSPIQFKQDLQVYTPWNSPQKNYAAANVQGASQTTMGKMQVVGVIEKFAWNGGVGDALQIDFWVSQENAIQLKSAQQSTLTTTKVDSLGWWIINYNQEKKVWYEQSYPSGASVTIKGIVGPKGNPQLNVDLTGAAAASGIDVKVYKVSIQVTPAANQVFPLAFASSATTPVIKTWGLQVGTLAGSATH